MPLGSITFGPYIPMQNAKQQKQLIATKRLPACRPMTRNSRHIVAISIVQGVILIRPVVSLIDPTQARFVPGIFPVMGGLPHRTLSAAHDRRDVIRLSLCVADVTRVLSIEKCARHRCSRFVAFGAKLVCYVDN